MAIPTFTADGLLPPYIGENPGGPSNGMSPYEASAEQVVDRFAVSSNRCEILDHWLRHRNEMRELGIVQGFQWLDGSFVEDKEPNDLDLVTFLYRPQAHIAPLAWEEWLGLNLPTLQNESIAQRYRLDFFVVDLHGHPETTVDISRYWLGLFSHKRATNQWKGMLKVRLEGDDSSAALLLQTRTAALGAAT